MRIPVSTAISGGCLVCLKENAKMRPSDKRTTCDTSCASESGHEPSISTHNGAKPAMGFGPFTIEGARMPENADMWNAVENPS